MVGGRSARTPALQIPLKRTRRPIPSMRSIIRVCIMHVQRNSRAHAHPNSERQCVVCFSKARWRGVAWWPGALLRLAFCFLLFQHKPMATRPLLVVCALAIRSPPLMQARPATSGLKDAPSREVYGVHGAAAWGCGTHLSNEPSVPKGSVRSSAQCTGGERKDARAVLAQYCRRLSGDKLPKASTPAQSVKRQAVRPAYVNV